MEEKTARAPKVGLIFDLDGTILDDIDLVGDYFEHEFSKMFNVEWNEEIAEELKNEVLKMIQGRSTKSMILKALWWIGDYFGLSFFQKIKFIKHLSKHYKETIPKCPLFEGAYEGIKKISEHPEMVTCMNTSSADKEVDQRFLGREELLDMFNGPLINRSVIENLKPHPESIDKISEATGIPHSNLFMIGDMVMDIKAGLNARVHTVGVASGHLSMEELKEAGAKYVFPTVVEFLDELPHILTSLDLEVNPPLKDWMTEEEQAN